MNRQLYRLAVLSCLLLAAFAPVAQADLIFDATLLGTNEVPPRNSPAFGFIAVDLHADMITLDVSETFTGLSAPALAAHIQCCAPLGANSGVVLPFPGFPAVVTGSYTHTFNLNTDLSGITAATFVAGIEAGLTYANIHDSVFPGGEIRGQLAGVPEPSTWLLLGSGLAGLILWRKRTA